MKVTAKATFVHGSYSLKSRQNIDLPASTARELEAAGLVSIAEEKKAPEPENKMAPKPANKAKKED